MTQQDWIKVIAPKLLLLAAGRELLELANALRESKAHPHLDKVFEHMQDKVSMSIDFVENPPTMDSFGPTHQ
ncbi:hypothetical protein [Pseudomonas sp. DWRC2-2]|uniref:hypothetical protein n=1 Tax=Pseudomonas sp. DWRC2-2 TaxID=2804567 RepID=UPI003CF99484